MILARFSRTLFAWIALSAVSVGQSDLTNQEGELEIEIQDDGVALRILGDKDEAWVYESSTSLQTWTRATEIPALHSDHDPVTIPVDG